MLMLVELESWKVSSTQYLKQIVSDESFCILLIYQIINYFEHLVYLS
jgi:hypothetical protein